MRAGHIIIVIVAALLLALSVVVAQAAFLGERTLMSYSYTRSLMREIIAPIQDDRVHEQTVRGAYTLIRREPSLSIPHELSPYVEEAAVRAFDADWISGTLERMLYSVQQVLNGRATNLSLPLSIAAFKNELLQITRVELSPEEMAELSRELATVPSTVDLADELDPVFVRRLASFGRSAGVVSFILQYVVPAVFILLCFAVKRVGTGITGVGAGLLAGGAPALVGSTIGAARAGEVVRGSVQAAVPGFAGWIAEGAGAAAERMVGAAAPVAVVVSVCGALLACAGVYLIATGRDIRIQSGG